eukprot:TRINITY_DN7905_c0_g2_i1.p1 TRINITY_DN7905_c0_g2~~TRINITY_DN7905_c0_g2_i1.p1  ORF type:complete len:115 (-),score=4.61 TRINITY_DN7905_c0_g2_i1:47-391(-)
MRYEMFFVIASQVMLYASNGILACFRLCPPASRLSPKQEGSGENKKGRTNTTSTYSQESGTYNFHDHHRHYQHHHIMFALRNKKSSPCKRRTAALAVVPRKDLRVSSETRANGS